MTKFDPMSLPDIVMKAQAFQSRTEYRDYEIAAQGKFIRLTIEGAF